ncbi:MULTISPECIES: hypothetical protein [Bacillus cereus group]|uniref:hypothetical protein n=1 Tax=Bacillus cereus group TaxID=86661 RepID=UPI000BF9E432|nr:MULTISPECIES: hypothetical protein [Bacillus cereus group]MDX6045518.1 hypothetical protein [Bacillus paranthracis]PFL36334.1 hypothetical protein COJ06_17880 [Bacillus cereus]PGQ68225.1 hypothetical protein COA27_23395 [Bacillus cereus]
MNIREWFGYDGKDIFSTESDKYLNKLFSIYAQALKYYFSADNASRFSELLHSAKTSPNLTDEQILFLEWIEEKGLETISKYISKSIPNDQELIAQLEYEIYMLEAELDFDYPEDVISGIIDTTNLLPEIINPVLEVSASTNSKIEEMHKWDMFFELDWKDTIIINEQIVETSLQRDQRKNLLYNSSYSMEKDVYLSLEYKDLPSEQVLFFDV